MGMGLLLVAPVVMELFSNKEENKVKDIGSIPDNTITDIVLKWENLCDACEDLGLEQASLKLEEVFPLLCKKKKTEKLASNETD
tara:strand:+ start:333 stop:584 length:252 start_codon:yes stop_codon:yes gene_type:complete